MKQNPAKHASSLLTLVHMSVYIGMAFGVGYVGVLSDFVHPVRTLVWPMIGIIIPIILYLYMDYLPEQRKTPKFNFERYRSQSKIFQLAILFSILAIVNLFISLNSSTLTDEKPYFIPVLCLISFFVVCFCFISLLKMLKSG
eukprot:UN30303